MDIEQIKEYYSNLLIIQYNSRPKAKAMIELLIKTLFPFELIEDVQNAYNVDTAVGVQLDVIGQWVGVNRTYIGQDFGNDFFGLMLYEESEAVPTDRKGFCTYSTFNDVLGDTLTYADILSPTKYLSDADFRILIKLKIIQNNIDHSHKSIDESLFRFFDDSVYANSRGLMDMTFFVPAEYSELIKVAIQKEILPRPMGVQAYLIKYRKMFFGMSDYSFTSPRAAGFSTYADYGIKEGETLNYKKIIET